MFILYHGSRGFLPSQQLSQIRELGSRHLVKAVRIMEGKKAGVGGKGGKGYGVSRDNMLMYMPRTHAQGPTSSS